MAIFPEFQPEEWIFFPFIFASVLVFAGAIGSYSDFFLVRGAAQLFDLPIQHVVNPLVNTGNAVLAMLAIIAFVWYFGKVGELFTPAFVAAIIFGSIALLFHA